MRVLIVSQYYSPENVPIPAALARGLRARGHEVRVITGFPNYPAGELFEGYSLRWRQRERVDGIQILRVPLVADHSARAAKRLLNYLSFGVSAASARGFGRGADVIYVYATQMTAALGPWVWRLTGGAPYVLHVQDLWPESIMGSSMLPKGWSRPVLSTALSTWLRSVYRQAASVVGIAPSMVATLADRITDQEKTHLVFNWADENGAPPVMAGVPLERQTTEVVYAGNVGDMQDLETAVSAAHGLSGRGLRLTIVGDGLSLARVRRHVHDLQATNVRFLDPVPAERMREVYDAAHYSLVPLKDLPVFRGTIPSKLQGSLAHGLPVITTVQGDVRQLVETLGVGFTANAEDVASLADAMGAACVLGEAERMQMASRATATYRARFSYDSGVDALTEILAAAAEPRRASDER